MGAHGYSLLLTAFRTRDLINFGCLGYNTLHCTGETLQHRINISTSLTHTHLTLIDFYGWQREQQIPELISTDVRA